MKHKDGLGDFSVTKRKVYESRACPSVVSASASLTSAFRAVSDAARPLAPTARQMPGVYAGVAFHAHRVAPARHPRSRRRLHVPAACNCNVNVQRLSNILKTHIVLIFGHVLLYCRRKLGNCRSMKYISTAFVLEVNTRDDLLPWSHRS